MTDSATFQSQVEKHFGGLVLIGEKLTLEIIQKGIAASGVGLDHTIGERVVAVGDNSRNREFEEFFMLTDRQITGRHGRSFFQSGLEEIVSVSEGSSFGIPTVRLQKTSGPIEIKIGTLSRQVIPYLRELCERPAGTRTPQANPIPTPTPSDLMNDSWASTNAALLGPACEQMMLVVVTSFRRNTLSFEASSNLITRIILQSRNSLFGRGMASGWWISPLPLGDLQEAISRLVGSPRNVSQHPNLVVGDFDLPRSGAATKAVASSAAGLAAAALFGVGWVSVPRKTVSRLRISLSCGPGMTCFQIDGAESKTFVRLSFLMPSLLSKCLEVLNNLEEILLYRRVLFGWEESAAQLLMKSDDELSERLRQIIR
ncbi:MAG: hypothetical protein C5B55_07785 [Blastocatellia bacterium]|nr:MAG: hypothetical protein C5B55_07785 [Blastocatellia bacterium]